MSEVPLYGAGYLTTLQAFEFGGLGFGVWFRLLYHSTLGLRVIKKKKRSLALGHARAVTASERRGNNSTRFKDFCLKAKAKMRP